MAKTAPKSTERKLKMGSSSPRLIRVAIVGAGQIAKEIHLPVFAKLPAYKVTGIYDMNLDRARRVAETFGIQLIYPDLDRVFLDKVDMIDICTPPQSHAEIVTKGLNHRIHCLVEKPFAVTPEEANLMVETAARNQRKVFPIQNYAFVPAMLRAKSMIERGDIGRVVSASIRYYASFDDHRHRFFLEKDHWVHGLPGDVFSDLAPHAVYSLLEFIGRPISVKALCKNTTGDPNVLGSELEVIVTSEDAIGSLALSYGSTLRHLSAELVGTKGGFRIDGNTHAVVRLPRVGNSRSIMSRAAPAVSEIFQLTKNIVLTGVNVSVGNYSPVTYGHEYLFRRCIGSLLRNETYPVDIQRVVDTVDVCERISDQIGVGP